MADSTSGTHHEVETKLDAEADFLLPDLSALPHVSGVADGEVHELEAVYLDSADLRLARHGTTFRRRTGGTDAGWHLKLPAAKTGRIEVRRAAGRSVGDVPRQLLGLVRVQVRGADGGPGGEGQHPAHRAPAARRGRRGAGRGGRRPRHRRGDG